METRYLTVIAVLAALAVSGGAVAAQEDDGVDRERGERWAHRQGPRDGFGGPEQIVGRMAERLDLDESQRDAISNILQATRPEFESLREQSRANRQAMHGLDVDDADYGAKLQNLSLQSGELAARLALLMGRVRADVHAVLTPEQQQELAEAGERMFERGGRGPRLHAY